MLKAVSLDPRSMIIHTAVGDAYYYAREFEKSVVYYRMAVELDPRNPELRNALADLYFKAGDPDAADAQQEKALLIDPDSVYPNIAFKAEHDQNDRCDQ